MFYMVIYVKIHRQSQQKRLFWLSYLLYKPRGLCFNCGAVCAVRCVFYDQDEDQFACMMVACPKWEKQNLISVIAWTLFGLVCFWRLISWMTVEKMLCFVVAWLAALVVLLGRDGATMASGFPYDILVWKIIMYGLQSKWFGQTLREGILWYRIILFLSMRCKRLQWIGLHDSVQIFSERNAMELSLLCMSHTASV